MTKPTTSYIEMPYEEFIKIATHHMPGAASFNYGTPELYTESHEEKREILEYPTIIRFPILTKHED